MGSSLLDMWTQDEKIMLLDLVAAEFNPDSLLSFRKELNKIDWSYLSNETGKSEDDCYYMLQALVNGVKKQKNLHELVHCSKLLLNKPEKKAKVTAYQLYIKKYKDKICARAAAEKKNLLIMASIMWKQESQSVIEEIKENILQINSNGNSEISEKIPCQYELYYEKKKDTIQDQWNLNVWRSHFKQLSDSKKMKYLTKAAKKLMNYIDSIETEDDKTEVIMKSKFFKASHKSDLILYLQTIGAPEPPPASLVSFLYKCNKVTIQDYVHLNSHLQKINQAVKNIPEAQKKQYKLEFNEKKEKYKEDIENFYANCHLLDSIIYERIYPVKKTKERVKKVSIPSIIANLNKIETPLVHKRWPDGPKLNFKPHQIYAKHFNLDDFKFKDFQSLKTEEKQVFLKKSVAKKEKCKRKMLDYVNGLRKTKHKRLYIGINRIPHVRIFGEDIYKEEFPEDEFPAFEKISPQKKNNELYDLPLEVETEKNFNSPELSPKKKKKLSANDDYLEISPKKKKHSVNHDHLINSQEEIMNNVNSQESSSKKKKKKLSAILDHHLNSQEEMANDDYVSKNSQKEKSTKKRKRSDDSTFYETENCNKRKKFKLYAFNEENNRYLSEDIIAHKNEQQEKDSDDDFKSFSSKKVTLNVGNTLSELAEINSDSDDDDDSE